jgi:hypothetical protein
VLPLLLLLLSVASAQEPCLDPDDVVGDSIPYDGRLDSEHISLRWNTADAPEDPQFLLDSLENAWDMYSDQGFEHPNYWPKFGTLALVQSIPGSTAGFTRTVDCGSTPHSAMVFDTSRTNEPGITAALAAHELFHAVQLRYRPGGFPSDEQSWFTEASAVLATRSAAPADTAAALFHAEGWAEQPWASWDTPGQHEYGLWVLLAHLDERDPGWHLPFWEAVRGDDPYDAREILEELTDWEPAYTRFLQDLPMLTLDGLEIPRPEDHGGLRGDGVPGDAFDLDYEGDGAATARLDVAGLDGAVVVELESPWVWSAASDGSIVERGTGPAPWVLLPDGVDTLYITAAEGDGFLLDLKTEHLEPEDLIESTSCSQAGTAGILLLPLLAIRRKIRRNQA